MKLRLCAGLAAMLTILAGCFDIRQSPPSVEFYTLEYDPPNILEAAPLPFIIKIEPFSTSPVYDSNKISYKEQKFKASEYAYHKWRAVPGELASTFLARDFAHSALFHAIVAAEIVPVYSHLITGHVEEFYRLSKNGSCSAVLSITVTLSSLRYQNMQDAILLQKRYAYQENCPEQTPQGFVEAMSRAMQQLSGSIIDEVYRKLSDLHR